MRKKTISGRDVTDKKKAKPDIFTMFQYTFTLFLFTGLFYSEYMEEFSDAFERIEGFVTSDGYHPIVTGLTEAHDVAISSSVTSCIRQ